MRKVGSISASLGFIFLGVVWIIYQSDPQGAYYLSKFWPGIFILMGIEFIIESLRRDDKKASFNWLCILVIIMLGFSLLIMKILISDFTIGIFENIFY